MNSEQTMTNAAAWGLILGVVTPYLTALVNQPQWSDQLRRGIALAVSVLVGLVNALVNSQVEFGAESALASVAAVVIASQTAYTGFLKKLPSGVKTIERLTSSVTSSVTSTVTDTVDGAVDGLLPGDGKVKGERPSHEGRHRSP